MTKKIITKDCVIIGGGPGGLTAGIYLQRFRHSSCILDHQQSRAKLIPRSHNYPGMVNGITGEALLTNLRKQYKKFNGTIIKEECIAIKKERIQQFSIQTDTHHYHAKFIILATGVLDFEPVLPKVKNAIQNGLIRHCAVCDGYEVIGKNIAVLVNCESDLSEALFLKTYSDSITLINLNDGYCIAKKDLVMFNKKNIIVLTNKMKTITFNKANKAIITMADGKIYHFDTIYSALGYKARSDLAKSLKIRLHKNKKIIVDNNQQTSMKNVYAIGDIVDCLQQICVATSHGAIAASAIHQKIWKKKG